MKRLMVALALGASLAGWPRPALGQNVHTVPVAEVQNNFAEPIAVFLEQGRFDRLLGTVDALSTATLPLPDWIVRGGQVQLFVVRRGGQELESHWFEARAGATVRMMVPSAPAAADMLYMKLPPDQVFETTLTVLNERGTDIVVYAREGSFHVRLGTVPAHATATLSFPPSVVGPDRSVTVVAHPTTGFELESYPLQLRTETHLALRLRPTS
jgi:hypothetical protein